MRLFTTVVPAWFWISLALALGCGGRATPRGAGPATDFPLPPLSPTVIGALIAEADRLALDEAQRGALAGLDDGLRARYAATDDELHALRDQRRPRMAPSGDGRGGGGRGGPGGGGRGEPPAGAGAAGAPRASVDPDAQRAAQSAARDRADALLDERDRDQHASVARALDLFRDDQLDAARAIIDDYFARAAAPPRALPPVGGGEQPATGRAP